MKTNQIEEDEVKGKKQIGRPRGSGKSLIKEAEEQSQLQIGEILPLSKIESRSVTLEEETMDLLHAMAAQACKGRKQKVDANDVLANLVLQLRSEVVRFNVRRSRKTDVTLTLPAYAWTFLDALASENKAEVSETVEFLINNRVRKTQKEVTNDNK